MAIRFRKGRKAPWQVYWNNPFTGKRESASFLTQEEALKEDSLIKHRLRFDRESFAVDGTLQHTSQEPPVATLEECFLAYLKWKQFTKNSLAKQLDNMRLALKRMGTMPVDTIDEGMLEKLMEELASGGVRPATVRKRMATLRTVLRWGEVNGYCGNVAFPRLPAPQYERFVPPTVEEIAAMMCVAPPHLQRVIILGAQFGVRVGSCELFQLTWDDVDWAKRVLRVHGSRKNPNAPWREVPIREALVPVFEQWHQEDVGQGIEYLVHWQGKPIGVQISGAWRKTLRRAGITRRIRPYDLRHAFGTELVAAGVDVGTVARLMGHSNPIMLLNHYQYVMDSQKRAAVEALPDAPAYVPKAMCPKGTKDKNIKKADEYMR